MYCNSFTPVVGSNFKFQGSGATFKQYIPSVEKNYKFGLIFLCENLKRREGLKGLKVAEGLEKILYNMYKDNVGQNSKKD